MLNSYFICLIFCLSLTSLSTAIFGIGGKSDDKKAESLEHEEEMTQTQVCPAPILGGVSWILKDRRLDYGWKENTHRAVIALAVSDWKNFTEDNERRLMEQQLEVELTKALLRNSSSPIYPNNLGLYIHALIAINKNPRNFHGIDLVQRLDDMTQTSAYTKHPFILLVLCNAKSMSRYHLDILEYYLRSYQDTRLNIEYKALALQAYECAGTLGHQLNSSFVHEAQRYLANHQYIDGSFGNVYTTALLVQALAASPYLQWNKEDAMDYLRQQSVVEVNMISSYLIQLALNVDRVRFIKDLYTEPLMGPAPIKKYKDNFIQYSLRIGRRPNVHYTLSVNVPPNSNFFEIMKFSAENDPKYNFSYYMDKKDYPSIYAISNVPNDAEENFYWRLCLQTDINHNRHKFRVTTFRESPIKLFPKPDEHVIYWYSDRDCEEEY